MDDASIDEFADAGDAADADDESGDDGGAGATGAETEPAAQPTTDPDPVEPAASTYAWSGAGSVCATCGESVARRWQDGDELVCADCKEW